MSRIVRPNGLEMTRFTIGFLTYGTEVRSDYTGDEELVRSAVGRWGGTVAWTGADLDEAKARANDRGLAGWHMRLGGLDNVVTERLPPGYVADLPDGAGAALASLILGETLQAEITLTDNDGKMLTVGSCITIGDRLYVVDTSDGAGGYELLPRVLPTGRALEVKAPVVRMRLDGTRPAGYIGRIVPGLIYSWVEAPG